MRKRRIKTIISVIAIATMMLSSMGIGVFAEVEQTAPAVQAQGEEEMTAAEPETATEPTTEAEVVEEETQQVEPEEPTEAEPEVTAKEGDSEEPVYLNQGVTTTRTISGHQRIKVAWKPLDATITEYEEVEVKVNVTKYIVYRDFKGRALGNDDIYCTIELKEDGTVASYSGNATNGSWTTNKAYSGLFKNSKWTKLSAIVGVTKTKDGEIAEYYFEDRDVGDGLYDNYIKMFRGGDWTYKIVPVAEKDGKQIDCNPAKCKAVTDYCVRTSAVKLKVKVNKSLKSHDNGTKAYFKKGSTIVTCAFGYGRYQFIHNGRVYWLNRVGTKSHTTIYNKNALLTNEEAIYFINGRNSQDGAGLTSSKTNWLIWVNTYTQRIFVFYGAPGKYTIKNGGDGKLTTKGGWYVSTGKPATPTIRYMDPKDKTMDKGRIVAKCKMIDKKVKKRHGIPSWNCFSTWNAIHGQKKKWSIKGVPKSNGCVRNTNAHANWIYKNCPKKTRVLIF